MNKLSMITVKITDLCNFNCSYCFERKDLKNRPTVFNKIDELLPFFKKFEYEDKVKAYLFGGELFLFPDVIEKVHKTLIKIQRYKNTKLGFAFVSNASQPEIMNHLIKDGIFDLDICKISYDGVCSHFTRYKKGFENDPIFSSIMNNNIIKLANTCKDKVLISMAVNEKNIDTLFYTYNFLNDCGYKKFEYYYIFGDEIKSENYLFEKKLEEQLEKIMEVYDNSITRLHNYELYKRTYNYNDCTTLPKQIYVTTDGTIFQCGLLSEMYYLGYSDTVRKFNISDKDLNIEEMMEYYNKIAQNIYINAKEFCQDVMDCQSRHTTCNTCPLEKVAYKKIKWCPIKKLRETEDKVFYKYNR